MAKLQKLGKVELLELVRALTEELEEVRLKNEVLMKPGGTARQVQPEGAVVDMAAIATTGFHHSGYGRLPPPEPGEETGWEQDWQRSCNPPQGGGETENAQPPNMATHNFRPKLLEEMEGLRRTIGEICGMAEQARAEMDRCMRRVELSMQQWEDEDKQMVEQVGKMMETVKSQRVIQ